MGELLISLLFIGIGLYSASNYKNASKDAIKVRTKNFRNLFGKELKVSKITEDFHEKFSLVISIIFLLVGLAKLGSIIISHIK